VLAQAAGLAFLAALSPTALLVAAVYAGSERPRLTLLFYLAGAVLMSLAMGVVVLAILRSGHLQRPSNYTPRYGLRLGLGILLLAGAAWVSLRRPKPPDPEPSTRGFVSRLISNPAPVTAFVAGLAVFAPGLTFVAAVQVIATARAGVTLTAFGLILVAAINVLLVWLPLVAFLAVPELTTRTLRRFNAWLRAHAHMLLSVVLLVAGVLVTVNGAAGLIGGT